MENKVVEGGSCIVDTIANKKKEHWISLISPLATYDQLLAIGIVLVRSCGGIILLGSKKTNNASVERIEVVPHSRKLGPHAV